MNKNIYGRHLKRDTNERKALFKSLMTALVLRGRIQTTHEKAKAIRGSIDKLVTKAKKKGILAASELTPYLHKDAIIKMISEIAPRFVDRPGGFTRIIKLSRRFGDDAKVVVMEWVEDNSKLKIKNSKLDEKVDSKKVEKSNKERKSVAKIKSEKKDSKERVKK
jgi:large subunit ribosomal protein L17